MPGAYHLGTYACQAGELRVYDLNLLRQPEYLSASMPVTSCLALVDALSSGLPWDRHVKFQVAAVYPRED
jgi:hypothetical protein